MKYIILFMLLLFALAATTQIITKSAEQIRDEIARIKSQTNWESDAEADTANVKIKRLAKELIILGDQQRAQKNGQVNDSTNNEEIKKGVEYRMQLWGQMQESAAKGESSDILLGTPIREEIVEAYKEEDTRKPIPLMTENLDILMIDMSLKGIQALVDNMPLFRSITKLIITSSEPDVPVDLSYILKKAAAYPLKELYIVNFGAYVTELPSEISQFDSLCILGIFNNNIVDMPKVVADFKVLKEFYIDNNPLATTFPVINQFRNLEVLGLMNTEVSETEISTLKNMFPACKILTE
jgi:hypothetical protein